MLQIHPVEGRLSTCWSTYKIVCVILAERFRVEALCSLAGNLYWNERLVRCIKEHCVMCRHVAGGKNDALTGRNECPRGTMLLQINVCDISREKNGNDDADNS